MSANGRLSVALGARSYDIHIGPDELERLGGRMTDLGLTRPPVVVVDEAVAAAGPLDRLLTGLERVGRGHRLVAVPAGEGTKSLDRFARLVEDVLAAGIERRTPLIALGGGVTGDLAGFAASVLLRGLPLVQAPTTLLAQVDSAVGGKTAVNSRAGKNLIGTFYQPRLVAADTRALDSLPARELRAGYAEVVKYGLLGDARFFGWLEENGPALLAGDEAARVHAIGRSCALKAEIVAEDERETGGRRALLNLGHTFGHAFEALCGYDGRVLHGEAIACGMILAFELSVRLGLCAEADLARARDHLHAVGLPVAPRELTGFPFATDDVLDRIARDKKVQDGRLTFVLVRGIGRAFVTGDVDPADLQALLAERLPV